MSSQNEKTLRQAIDEAFSLQNLKRKVAETRIVTAWEKISGKLIARHTRRLFIRNATLFIYLDNPALKNELTFCRNQIIELVNAYAGENLIQEVIVK
ncbi:MAG: hypothetical protein KatS3mg031_2582 [Chitinophagales bacterium]|nr:MAG: hypothetical protein KatS3mg031_2582 [Chitinophagales bacterium]